MILNPKRPTATRFGTICGLVAAVCLLALIGILSLGTLRPLSADDESATATTLALVSEVPASEVRSSPPKAEVQAAPAFTQKTITVLEEVEEGTPARVTDPPEVTLKVTLMARDFDRVSYAMIKALAEFDRVDFQMQGTQRHALKAELDERNAKTVIEELQTLEGVRTLCRSTIIALSGQQAAIEVREPGPRVEVEEINGTRIFRQNQSQDIHHRFVITSRTTTDPNRLEVTVFGGRLKQTVGVDKTLMLVRTDENEILFISPTKVQRPVATLTARIPSNAARAAAEPPTAAAAAEGPGGVVGQPSNVPSNADRQTELKLLELDLAEAKLGIEEAEAEVQSGQELLRKLMLSPQQLRQREVRMERAKIQVQRIQVRLDSVRPSTQTPAPPPTLAPRR